MTAMDQVQVERRRHHVQVEYEAIQRQIADLQAKQAVLQRALTRLNLQRGLLAGRRIPSYASWLPFSANGSNVPR